MSLVITTSRMISCFVVVLLRIAKRGRLLGTYFM